MENDLSSDENVFSLMYFAKSGAKSNNSFNDDDKFIANDNI